MPTQVVEIAQLRIPFASNDTLVLFGSDGAFGLKSHFRPKTLGNERPGKPVHREAEVVKFPKVHIGADSSRLETGKQLLGLSLNNNTISNQVECSLLGCPPPAVLR